MLHLFFAVAFSAVPLTLYIPPVRSLNLFVETMEDIWRESSSHTGRIFPRLRLKGQQKDQDYVFFARTSISMVQVIDDSKMHTLASASIVQKPISEEFDYSSGPTIDIAKRVGEIIAKTCLEKKGITKVAFDRDGYTYHGRIEVLADSARSGA